MEILVTNQIAAGTAIACVCAAYLAAFSIARAGRPRRSREHPSGKERVGRAARLLGSAGVALAIVSPAAAAGEKPGGRSGGPSRQTTAPPWDSKVTVVREPGSVESVQRAVRPWDTDPQPTESQHAPAESSAPPWSGDDGSSPPRPLPRTGAEADAR